MWAQFLRNSRPHAKRVDASVDGVSDRGSTPLASTFSKIIPQVGPPVCGIFCFNAATLESSNLGDQGRVIPAKKSSLTRART